MLCGMDDRSKTAIERAFEIARVGDASNIVDLRRTLAAEGYSQTHVTGRTLTRQLTAARLVTGASRRQGEKCGEKETHGPNVVTLMVPSRVPRGGQLFNAPET